MDERGVDGRIVAAGEGPTVEADLGYLDDDVAQDVRGIVDSSPKARVVITVVIAAVALFSFFFLGEVMSDPETHSATVASLDEKKGTVMGLVAASTAASAAVTLLPGDAGTPIAEKLADLSTDFLIVIVAIYLEKYLLTVLGFAAFKILVPVGCVIGIAGLWLRKRYGLGRQLAQISAKLVLFGLAISVVVPAAVGVSGMIESAYASSISETVATAEETTEAIEGKVAEGADQESGKQEEGGLLDFITQIPSSIANTATETVQNLTAAAQNALNRFVEALAVMIVTSCVIPILVLIFFLWLVKILLGVNVDAPMRALSPRSMRSMNLLGK